MQANVLASYDFVAVFQTTLERLTSELSPLLIFFYTDGLTAFSDFGDWLVALLIILGTIIPFFLLFRLVLRALLLRL
jgi:hypothetical protein